MVRHLFSLVDWCPAAPICSQNAHSVNIRSALHSDIPLLVELDPIADREAGRREFIAQSVAAGQCWVATGPGQEASPLGYGVLNRAFFDHPFIALVVVKSSARRRGVATAIVRSLASQCDGAKLFTSTNTSNLPMRALLEELGFVASGRIDNLDDGDPELVFVKFFD